MADEKRTAGDRFDRTTANVSKIDEDGQIEAEAGAQAMPLNQVASQGLAETVPRLEPEELTKHWDSFGAFFWPGSETRGGACWRPADGRRRVDARCVALRGLWFPVPEPSLARGEDASRGITATCWELFMSTDIARLPNVHACDECYGLLIISLVRFGAVELRPMMYHGRLLTGHVEWDMMITASM